MAEATIVSIQVGLPQTRQADAYSDTPWTSGIVKLPVNGSVWLSKTQLEGDGQADLKNHGGPDRVILIYAQTHYDYWKSDLPHIDWVNGGFGENLTVTAQTEDTVCVGDIYRIGVVRIQVSQPRAPCWKLARRWNQKDLADRADKTGFTGWYARVLDEGNLEAGMMLSLEERPYPQWTIRQIQQVRGNIGEHLAEAIELAQCDALSADVRERTQQKIKNIQQI